VLHGQGTGVSSVQVLPSLQKGTFQKLDVDTSLCFVDIHANMLIVMHVMINHIKNWVTVQPNNDA